MKRRTFIALGAGAAVAAAVIMPELKNGRILAAPNAQAAQTSQTTQTDKAAQAAQPAQAAAGSVTVKTLPQPDKNGGMPLMQALAERKSNRSFSDQAIDDQTLSNLLWATWGVNRPNGKHTAPTGRDRQQIALYAALPDGIWLYNPDKHCLELQVPGDQRKNLGAAPLVLLFCAPDKDWGPMELGALYQNSGLYCASAGLANVVKAQHIDAARKIVPVPKGYYVLITQSIGWPA